MHSLEFSKASSRLFAADRHRARFPFTPNSAPSTSCNSRPQLLIAPTVQIARDGARNRAGLIAMAKKQKTDSPSAPPQDPEVDDDDYEIDEALLAELEEDGFLADEDEDVNGLDGFSDADDEFEDNAAPGEFTGGVSWGEIALEAAQKVLRLPALDGLELYLFEVVQQVVSASNAAATAAPVATGWKTPNVHSKVLDIRLDQLADKYGSPSGDDLEKFSRMFFLELEVRLGEEQAGTIGCEVSTPGAERQLRLPQDLVRFNDVPMFVKWKDEEGKPAEKVMELSSYDADGGVTVWRLADVAFNSPVKGRKLSKRMREKVFEIKVENLMLVHIYVDF
eukprot:gene361-1751_t